MKIWKGLSYVGAACMILFFSLGFYCLTLYGDFQIFGVLLGLNGMAVMAVFTLLCAIAHNLFEKNE